MRIENGYVVIDAGEDWSPFGLLIDGDQYRLGVNNWGSYAVRAADGDRFNGRAPFSVRRPIANCSPELLMAAGVSSGRVEAMHFL